MAVGLDAKMEQTHKGLNNCVARVIAAWGARRRYAKHKLVSFANQKDYTPEELALA